MVPRSLMTVSNCSKGISHGSGVRLQRRYWRPLRLHTAASLPRQAPADDTQARELDPRLQLEILLGPNGAQRPQLLVPGNTLLAAQAHEKSTSPSNSSFNLQAAGRRGGAGRPHPDVRAAAQQQEQQQQQEASDYAAAAAAPQVATAAAAAEVAGDPSHHHHHDEGVLTRLLNQALAKLGIQMSDRARGLLCLNALVLLYATNWVVIKDSESNFDPYAFSFLRFTVAAAAFAPFLKAASKDKRVVTAGLELGVWTAAGYLLQSQGLLTTDASRASFLSTFTVIIVPILAGLSGRGVQPLTWFSAAAALCGMSLLEGGGAPPSIGDMWSFLSALAFGVQVFRTEHWARTLGPRRALPLMSVVLAVTMACSLGAAVLAHPHTTLELLEHPWLVQQALTSGHFPWQAALYTGLLTTDVCLLFEVVALRDVPATEAAIIYALEPVLGAFFAYMLLGERWGPLGWAGAGLIIASSLVTQLYGRDVGEPVLESTSESEGEEVS